MVPFTYVVDDIYIPQSISQFQTNNYLSMPFIWLLNACDFCSGRRIVRIIGTVSERHPGSRQIVYRYCSRPWDAPMPHDNKQKNDQ